MPSRPNNRFVPQPNGTRPSRLGCTDLPVAAGRMQPDLPFVPRLGKRPDWSRFGENSAFVALELTGWAIGTTLFLLGGIVVVVLILGQGQLDLFFAQVDNFASRFMSADAARRLNLEHQLVQGVVLATLTLGLLRTPALLCRLTRELRSKVSAA